MLSTVGRKHLLSCYIDLPSKAYVSPICQRQSIGEYNWIFPRGSTWSSLLALSQCSLPSLTVFSLLRGHSVTAASLVSVREIKPKTFGLGQKPVSVTVCNFLISDMLACLAALPHSLSCSAHALSVGSCVELCEHLVDLLFGLCTAGILQRRGWAGSSLCRATVIELQPALLNLWGFFFFGRIVRKLAHLLPQATVQLEHKILSLCDSFLKLPGSLYVSWWCLFVLAVWVHVWGWWHAVWSHAQACFVVCSLCCAQGYFWYRLIWNCAHCSWLSLWRLIYMVY